MTSVWIVEKCLSFLLFEDERNARAHVEWDNSCGGVSSLLGEYRIVKPRVKNRAGKRGRR
jgi:hypothetical protein